MDTLVRNLQLEIIGEIQVDAKYYRFEPLIC